MDNIIQNSIDARKNAIFNAYDIIDSNILEKVEQLFEKMNTLGMECKDIMEFESKLASSSLNQEYIDLFTSISLECKEKNVVNDEDNEQGIKSDGYVKRQIVNEIEYQLDSATLPVRSKARQEVYEKAREMPVVGEILETKQYLDFFGRFKKKKR